MAIYKGSTKISGIEVVSNIDDITSSTVKTYSSNKIDEKLANIIDDENSSATATYSSNKIEDISGGVQTKDLSTAITINGNSVSTVEETLNVLNNLEYNRTEVNNYGGDRTDIYIQLDNIFPTSSVRTATYLLSDRNGENYLFICGVSDAAEPVSPKAIRLNKGTGKIKYIYYNEGTIVICLGTQARFQIQQIGGDKTNFTASTYESNPLSSYSTLDINRLVFSTGVTRKYSVKAATSISMNNVLEAFEITGTDVNIFRITGLSTPSTGSTKYFSQAIFSYVKGATYPETIQNIIDGSSAIYFKYNNSTANDCIITMNNTNSFDFSIELLT